MKANKLMIGDWVFLKNGKVLETCQVTVIGNATQNRNDIGKYVYLDLYSKFPACIFKIDEISPIPLTPEILEKNGFEPQHPKNHIETVYAYQDISEAVADELYALWPHRDGSFYLLLRVDGKDMVRMNVHYVHQLQHTLKLCGIEKEIVL